MNITCLMCGAPEDPDLMQMCRPCLNRWVEMKTTQWLKESARKLELFKLKEAA